MEFLSKIDVDLSVTCQLGGHSCERTHRNPNGPNVGFAIISALQKKFRTFRSSRAPSPSASFARIGRPTKLLERFHPGLETFPTTNGAWALGEGVAIAEDLGADLVHMDKIQLHPTGFINPKDRAARQCFLAPEAIRGSGAILLNVHGKRFVNELSTRDVVSQAILAQPERRAIMFLFQGGANKLESALGFYKHVGLVKQVSSVQEAADYSHFDAAALLQELNSYAAIAATPEAHSDPFGKQVFPHPVAHIASVDVKVDIYVMEVEPAIHYCMGECFWL